MAAQRDMQGCQGLSQGLSLMTEQDACLCHLMHCDARHAEAHCACRPITAQMLIAKPISACSRGFSFDHPKKKIKEGQESNHEEESWERNTSFC